jgi:4-hydroxythreonine-4-phosphate dehydrogenase
MPVGADTAGVRRQLPLALTMGDPAGIGPDIALLCWTSRAAQNLPPFVVFGDAAVLDERARQLGLEVPLVSVRRPADAWDIFSRALPVQPVTGNGNYPGSKNDRIVVAAIEDATAATARGETLAVVTNPIAKQSVQSIPLEYPGHTAFLGHLAARHWPASTPVRPVMMLVAEELRVVPVTVHIPLREVPRTLTIELLIDTVRITAKALRHSFGVKRPRIAMAGLNPHAGEGGLIGEEEATVIEPAIAALAAEGLSIAGPLSADSMFHPAARAEYDVAIAMYHDQALIPLKTLSFDTGVNVTLGLPFIRTSPDHGTAYALAGTGKARPHSLIAALRLAANLGARQTAPQSAVS